MGHGLHMRLVSADESRDAERAVYSPGSPQGMAHRSYPSPDGAWVLIAEMVRPVWQPCRLVSIDGRVTRRVGPDGQCTSAAWSPDGRWMYFSSNGSGSFHIWRQRFPDGAPEQISFAPGEEEGIAVARDGRSLFTSLGNRQSSIRVRDGSEEREVSHEGYAFVPAPPNSGVAQPFLAGGRLLYLVRHGPVVRFTGPGERAGELWETDPRTGRSEPLFPGVQVTGYDVSRDGSEIVFAALDDNGRSHVWLGRMDRTDPPREIVPVEADSPRFGAGGNIYYRSAAEGGPFIYRIDREGITQRAVARPVVFLLSVSPDGAWVVARVETSPGTDSSQSNIAFPTTGGKAPVRMCRMGCEVDWTPDGRGLVMRLGNDSGTSQSRTFVIALQPGESLPALPPEGIQSEADLVTVPVSASFDGTVYPSDVPSLVAYVRRATQRNIYRVPIP
jgi:dipeptidyl aminopeptidase/acylaminoacyl peptidase